MATTSLWHELHCLWFLRTTLYKDYYFPNISVEEAQSRVVHAGHCLHILQQRVMCSGDMTPMGMIWKQGRLHPLIEPSVSAHSCIDWEKLQTFLQERVVSSEEAAIAAMEYEIVIRFMFSAYHDESISLQRNFFTTIFAKAFQRNNTHIMKAALDSTGETIAFGIVGWADGKWDKPETPPRKTHPGPGVKFIDFYAEEEGRSYRQLMAGCPHYIWNSLYVLPLYQRKGIGSALLRWGFHTYGLEKETVFVQTFMGSREIYAKYGWQEVDATEINLAEWAGDGMGFGVHRSPQMIRQPMSFD
ncbi:hypothetical protein HYFRA_00004934 [Hymenoscyphus fraxineus]|uniref:N-acetyltransferase domain-containing protein n=1 Tax=Hymenoscyphus fraxineus TaxID=746836 RepID=A0A9N9KLQ8_9HELO|nr:hypothetical protein HYFRA_00004934 [Hymenoscyphus fraxineus]